MMSIGVKEMMMTSARKVRWIILLALAEFGITSALLAGEPLEVIKVSTDRAIQILKDPQLQAKEKKKERIQRLKEIANPLFDFEEMARRSLGSHWRRRSPQEQKEFVKLFRDFVEKTYSNNVDLYAGERIVMGKENIDNDYAQVDSSFVNPKGEEFSVVFRRRHTEGKWKVYDAVVENISIVNNYRSQFDRVISKSSFEELIRLLKEKTG
jgi:phospholipid transport system substrate-binding protein